MSMYDLAFEAVKLATKKLRVTSGPGIDSKILKDIDTTMYRKKKVVEWTTSYVSRLKSVSTGKELAIRRTIAHSIQAGMSRAALQQLLVEKFDLTVAVARRIALNEIRRAYNWAYKKTAYELGYRYVQFHAHPTACETCRSFDGRIYSITLRIIPNETHPNCQCWETVVDFKKVEPRKSAAYFLENNFFCYEGISPQHVPASIICCAI